MEPEKKYLFLTPLSLSGYFCSKALKLIGFTPKWEHITTTPEFPDSTYIYEPQGRPLRVNDDLYLLSNPYSKYFHGFLLEKLNVNNGKTIWTNQYYSNKKDERKYAYDLKQNGNNIDLFIFKENGRYNLNGGSEYWWESNFNWNRYCMDSGKLCDSIVTNPKDSLNITTRMADVMYGTAAGSSFFNNGNNFFYVEYYDNSKGAKWIQRFDIHTIDREGHRLDSFSIRINCKYDPIRTNIFEYKHNRYVAMIHCETSTGTKNNTLLVYFDEHFKVEKTYDISARIVVPAGRTYIRSITENSLVVCRYIEQKIKQDSFASVYNYTAFNHNGERLDYATVRIGLNDGSHAVLTSPSNKLLIQVLRRPQAKRQFEFYKSGVNGTIELLKTIPINKTISLFGFYNAGDNQILGYFYYRDSSKTAFSYLPVSTHWMMFTLESLGFTTPTQDIALKAFSFYPNPVSHQMTIQTDFDYDAIKVYSIEGKLIQGVDNQDNTLDISALHSGMYFFELWQHGKAITRKEKFIKLE